MREEGSPCMEAALIRCIDCALLYFICSALLCFALFCIGLFCFVLFYSVLLLFCFVLVGPKNYCSLQINTKMRFEKKKKKMSSNWDEK